MTFFELLALANSLKAIKEAEDVSVLHWKGSVATYASLPNNAEIGDMYHVESDGGEYAWDGTTWEPLGSLISIDDALSDTSENPVQNKVIYVALGEKYEKPVGGIPSTDMTSAVQTSLGKADTAEQAQEMTMAQYNALTQAQKMDGTVRYITDTSTLPQTEGVGF